MDSDSSDSDSEQYEMCCSRRPSLPGELPFDPASLENVILKIADSFDFRVILSEERSRNALLVTSGLSLAGSLIGKHYGGNLGAALGGAVGGICGIGIVAVSMRDIWEEIKSKLAELFDLVYDYLAGLGLNDYKNVAKFLTNPHTDITQLGLIVLQVTTDVLGKKVLSTLNS